MSDQSAILAAALRDAAVTREVALARGALAALPAVASSTLGDARLLIVADEVTFGVAGQKVLAHLEAAGLPLAQPLILGASPRLKPRTETAERIAAQLRESGCAAVAVGSGVVNDLVKYASALVGKPYVCVATAASMDGYAASGAALIDAGFKRTLACPPPVAVVADLDVVAHAPVRMAGWGYGDLAGKVVAGADWLLADALEVEAINPRPYAMVQDNLADWLDRPELLAQGDTDAFARLLSGLLVSGFAMQAHDNSRPASGSDHQFSHLWEMENLAIDGEPAAHGACVGIGCVAMLAFYEWVLAQPIGRAQIAGALAAVPDDAAIEHEIATSFVDPSIRDNARVEMRAKRAAGDRAMRLGRFEQQWPRLRLQLSRTLPSAHDMQRQLRATGAAAHPADIGVSLQKLAADYRRARLIRRRYTVLDLAEDLGLLDRAIYGLFAAGGFWAQQSDTGILDRRRHGAPAERVVNR